MFLLMVIPSPASKVSCFFAKSALVATLLSVVCRFTPFNTIDDTLRLSLAKL